MSELKPEDGPTDSEDAGLLFGCILDGTGGHRLINWPEAKRWTPTQDGQVIWLHVDRTVTAVDSWLRSELDLSDATVELLTSNETRPRAFRSDSSLVAVLRGVNFNEGAEPEDMIAMQIWADQHRVITLRRRRLQTPRDVLARLDQGKGPLRSGDLVTALIEQLVVNMSRAIVDMNDRIDELETMDRSSNVDTMLDEIAAIRRNCLALKRFMSPQHEALIQIQRDPPEWLGREDLEDIRETADRLKRYNEDLDVSKESAIVLQDDLNNRAVAESNKTMYMLSIVAAVFLPLSFITGLLGINVGGMPGVESRAAFWVTVGLLVLLLGVQIYAFKRLKWL